MTAKRTTLVAVGLLVLLGVVAVSGSAGPRDWIVAKVRGQRTVSEAVGQYGAAARGRLAPAFRDASVAYPPDRLVLAAIKSERVLEVWAGDQDGPLVLVQAYPILAASGSAGPKLQEGDRQVPEGRYRIIGLNPNSSYHLSMKLDYPNEFDRAQAERDGRESLGGEIFIHGSSASVGCLAMGDPVIEELFVLASDVGSGNVSVLIAPTDPRKGEISVDAQPTLPWLPELYEGLSRDFEELSAGGRS